VRRRAGGEDWSGQRARRDASGGGICGALSRAQQRDWGREQGTDVWGRRERERGLTVGRGHYAGFDKRVTSWVNGPGLVRNENRISDLDKGFPILQNRK
jgi:hypothetical protein